MGNNITAAVTGDGVDALQAALYLARLGVSVKFITGASAFTFNNEAGTDPRYFWSIVLQAIQHPSIEFFYNSRSVGISQGDGAFRISATQKPSYISPAICTGCKKCEENCSTRLTVLEGGKPVSRRAVHKPVPGVKSVPSAMVIEKNEIAPCRASCPLGINVQGFVSLLANNKTSEAYELINQSAPMGGILGRLCKHPCEGNCSRSKIDSPLSIRALHRYAYDSAWTPVWHPAVAAGDAPKVKVAIIGSGPAGLMAAWELKRKGYEPTIFESHSTFGGMPATGIPRFRLPREIREREIQKVLDMGIRVTTGITVGRDINFAYLKERDFKAFFLAIGASRNNRLNIPGEDLEGVIDCMSFLITLNQMDEAFVGSNIVIIGDGNSAVDSARVAIRKNKGSVKIVSWTVPEELTASGDEIEEAFQEGVSIVYSAYPDEILGSEGKVTGVRCRGTRLTDEIMRNGWHRPEPVPDTDFIIEADHVIIAIGQSADATQLNLEGLAVDKASGTIKVNPITLETSIKGIFAGGDCMRGPNNVVEAMADGVRAAESIDRYLRGSNLEEGRKVSQKKIAEVDLKSVVASPAARAEMPYLDMENRKNTYEETTLGLSPEQAVEEAGRCLSCALCSECMECVKVCKANAITHDDGMHSTEIEADVIWKFPAEELYIDTRGNKTEGTPKGIYDFTAASADAGDIRIMTGIIQTVLDRSADFGDKLAVQHDFTPIQNKHDSNEPGRRGIFLCNCNSNSSSAIDFTRLAATLSSLSNVNSVTEIEQACSEAGAAAIADRIREENLDGAIIAACRCCNYDEVCYSCNDRRILCQQYIHKNFSGRDESGLEYVNIRELCAWAHGSDRDSSTDKAVKLLEAAVIRSRLIKDRGSLKYRIYPAALFIGGEGAGKFSALTLEALGYRVYYLNNAGSKHAGPQNRLAGITYREYPQSIEIDGCPGDYQVKIENPDGSETLEVGAVILSSSLSQGELSRIGDTYTGRLIKRVLAGTDSSAKYESALAVAGIFMNSKEAGDAPADEREPGINLAGRILLYLRSNWIPVPALTAGVNAGLCRGCRSCADQCLLIEVRKNEKGLMQSYIEPYLCSGCGACASVCPTGAISVNGQGGNYVNASLKSYVHAGKGQVQL